MVEFDPEKHSDGCSMSPDGNWGGCCVEHDEAYFYGGSDEKRAAADKKLRECIQMQGLYRGGLALPFYGVVGWVYWLGPRLFGGAWLPTKFRWGYGEDFQNFEK